MDNLQLSVAVKFTNILTDFDLVQNVTGATHTAGHTLDVFTTCSSMQAQVMVEPTIISDHSVITVSIKLDDVAWFLAPTTVRRSLQSFDIDAFKNDLLSTVLVVNPPDDCDDFFALYDSTLKSLLDKHAPMKPTATRR